MVATGSLSEKVALPPPAQTRWVPHWALLLTRYDRNKTARPLQPYERTITRYTYSTFYRKYLAFHGGLNAPLPSPLWGRPLSHPLQGEAYHPSRRKTTTKQSFSLSTDKRPRREEEQARTN